MTQRASDPLFGSAPRKRALARDTAQGAAWAVSTEALRFALRFATVLLLARGLTPDDFGLVAMAAPILLLGGLLKDLGLSNALLRAQDLSRSKASTVFWLNLAVTVVLASLLLAARPLIVDFFDEARLQDLLLVLSGLFLVGSLSAQHAVLLKRALRFAPLAAVQVFALACGSVAALAALHAGLGYWSIVMLTGVSEVISAVALWCATRWIPGRPLPMHKLRSLLSFGGNLTVFNLLNFLHRQGDDILIGRLWGTDALGLYSKAYGLLLMPVKQINAPVSQVFVPVLARLREDPVRYRHYYVSGLRLVAALGMGFSCLVFTTIEPLIPLALGPQWNGMVPIFQALLPAALASSVNVAFAWVYLSWGHVATMARVGGAVAVLLFLGFVVSAPFGVEIMAWAYSGLLVASLLPGLHFCFRGTPITLGLFVKAVWRPLLCSLAAAGLGLLAAMVLEAECPLTDLANRAGIYSAAWVLVWLCLPGGWRCLKDTFALVAHFRPVAASAVGVAAPSRGN